MQLLLELFPADATKIGDTIFSYEVRDGVVQYYAYLTRFWRHPESSDREWNFRISQFSASGVATADLAAAFDISEEKVQELAYLLQEGGLEAFIEQSD